MPGHWYLVPALPGTTEEYLGECFTDLSNRANGGLASALIRLPTFHSLCHPPPHYPSCGMGSGAGGEVAEVTAGCSRGGMAVA